MKNMRQLINLMEDVTAVPGIGSSESDMQTAGTVGRDSADASFDAAQPAVDEAREEMYHTVFTLGPDGVWSHYFDADDAEDARAEVQSLKNQGETSKVFRVPKSKANWHNIDVDAFVKGLLAKKAGLGEKAPPGMEKTVKDIKKEYPGHPEKAFATAWSIYNKKHGKNEEMEMDEAGERKLPPPTIDPNVVNAMVALPHEEAKQKAHEILAASNTSDIKKGYLASQIDRTRNTMGVVKLLYDMILKGEGNGVQGSSYSRKFGEAADIAVGAENAADNSINTDEEMNENFDLNNGYNDINYADQEDYFPDGADSPVVKKVGPSGARQGDNPEQKTMAVAEHKELVYSYRKFLKEAAKK